MPPALQGAIERAKAAGVPKDVIERALKQSAAAATNAEAVVYEGTLPGGIAVIVDALTNNRKRTAPAVRHIFTKHGGDLGTVGSVSWMFERKGRLQLARKDGATEDDDEAAAIMDTAAGANALDVEFDTDSDGKPIAIIWCEPAAVATVRTAFEAAKFPVQIGEVARVPTTTVEVAEGEPSENFVSFLEALDAAEDVQEYVHNVV